MPTFLSCKERLHHSLTRRKKLQYTIYFQLLNLVTFYSSLFGFAKAILEVTCDQASLYFHTGKAYFFINPFSSVKHKTRFCVEQLNTYSMYSNNCGLL